jgi:hypothetical protein
MLSRGLLLRHGREHRFTCDLQRALAARLLHHVTTSSTKGELVAAVTECMEQARYHAPMRSAPDAVLFFCKFFFHRGFEPFVDVVVVIVAIVVVKSLPSSLAAPCLFPVVPLPKYLLHPS